MSQDHYDALKLDLALSTVAEPSEVVPIWYREEVEAADEFHDADWSDLTESQPEELVLTFEQLGHNFQECYEKIVANGYSEQVVTKAFLRSGIYYGSKDTVSNIVDNTLTFLRNGQEIDLSRERYIEDLQQMEMYILAELVCVLQEVRPFFSTGDAMWCLWICDVNVSHACAMDSDPLSTLSGDGGPNGNNSLHLEPRSSELNLPIPCKPNSSIACAHTFQCKASNPFAHCSQSETPTVSGVPNFVKAKKSSSRNGIVQEKESPMPTPDEKLGGSRKISGISKREYIHTARIVIKGLPDLGLSGFGGLILDKKLKSVSDSIGANVKKASLKISKATLQTNGNHNLSTNRGVPSSAAFNLETLKTSGPSTFPTVSILLALSLLILSFHFHFQHKAAMLRLSKDKVEIKSLTQEREEVERIKREKLTLEENTMKKLSEMENALGKPSGQVERANGTVSVRRLEVENAKLRLEMEGAKLHAVDSAASCQEASTKEKKTLMKFQSWEKQKALFQEELVAEKRKLAQLL
ncbi:hypothetical protein RHSIM_Rhsim04G0212500 [Rhododendron simsii]|uniref:PIR2-like helical domain-containing protein n=1 Tax=Rhododendron simsii TaxID=118357 RepID=A0A834H366_RHOSS|nr:hypothetical protein RHSIM_Rhsim04G0212500 [Rhododendron simsii]